MNIFSYVFKFVNIFIVCVLFNQISFAADTWQVLSELDDSERRDFLVEKVKGELYRKANKFPLILDDYYYNNQDMLGFGMSFSYLGDIEAAFLSHIQAEDETGPKVVLFPGCGYGRSVLDALAKTKNTFMIANDFSKAGMGVLAQAQQKWFPDAKERLSIKQGDIFVVLKNIRDKSVDTIFCTNLIHFFNPDKLELFFHELNRVLKKNGSVFLSWEGFSTGAQYRLSEENLIYQNTIQKLQEAKNPYPTYFSRDDLPKDLEVLPKGVLENPHNFVTLPEISTISQGHGFNPTSSATFMTMNVRGSMPIKIESRNLLFDQGFYLPYRVENIDFSKVLFALPNFFVTLSKVADDVETFEISENFRNGAWKEHIESHLCDHCKVFAVNIKKCGACEIAKYCGRACQKAAWSKHKPNCHKK